MVISVIIPALNGATTLAATLASLAQASEIVVVDGGSTDATIETARALGAHVVNSMRGRGPQLAAGVAATGSAWLLLLHADTRLGHGWEKAAAGMMLTRTDCAGYFRLAFDSDAGAARRLERIVAWRCRALGLPYGDQGLLISRTLLAEIGGIKPLPLMEDVDLVRRIGRDRLVALDATAITSAARYERHGWHCRSVRNLICLTLYLLGVPAHRIARLYR